MNTQRTASGQVNHIRSLVALGRITMARGQEMAKVVLEAERRRQQVQVTLCGRVGR